MVGLKDIIVSCGTPNYWASQKKKKTRCSKERGELTVAGEEKVWHGFGGDFISSS